MAEPFYDAEEFRRRVLRARCMTPEEKMLEGMRLCEEEVEREKTQLRNKYPQATEAEIRRRLCELIAERRRVEDQGLYVVLGD